MTGRITSIRFTPAHTGGGLIGWVSFVLDGAFLVDGAAVRRTLGGDLMLSWPGRKDSAGRLHRHLWPLDPAVRGDLEDELLAHLHGNLREGAA